jgi:cephalosporin hydroxylase
MVARIGLMIRIDFEAGEIGVGGPEGETRHALTSPEAFAILSEAWLRAGWANRYSYTFTWFGRPILQLPEDLIRLQELVYQLKPDVIVETGIAHGGSAIFLAGLCRLIGRGRVIGVDVEIRKQNRAAIEAHDFAPQITLIEGDSIAPETVRRVHQSIGSAESVLLILDSNHSKAHVLAELTAYAPLIRPGGYIIATDGIMEDLTGLPGTRDDWVWNNPKAAAAAFLDGHPEFERAPPPCIFNERGVPTGGSYWPDGYLRRVR